MKDTELFNFLVSEAAHPFSGWDFSYIRDRIVSAPLTWSYTSMLLPLMRKVDSLLDMGTGGGEFLSSLLPLPKHTCATENYKLILAIAKNKLEPLGVRVFYCTDDQHLPFKDEEFDLIINRHEFYSEIEVYRILKPNGIFITQQVGEKNDSRLRFILTGSEESENEIEWNLDYAANKLENTGFEILEKQENITPTRIFDVGAIVYYFNAVSWELPGFSIENYYDKLLEIHAYINENGYLELDSNNHRFIIKAMKLK
ncbi:MAG: class I SAM-dependent methyltransferase [Promethearchaeota archaeon]